MHKLVHKYLHFSFLLILALQLYAFQSNLSAQGMPFQNYSIQNGLSQSVVTDLMQDQDGYIWIATEYGLNRFNRFAFEYYFEKNGLGNNGILSLYQTLEGQILVGTESGLNIWNGRRFVRFPGTEILNDKPITSIFEDIDGGLWIGTADAGLFNFFQDSFTSYTTDNGLAANDVRKVAQMSDGQILVATRSGVSLVYGGDVRNTWNNSNGLSHNDANDILVREDGSFWVATRNGVSIFKDGVFTYLNTLDGLLHSSVTSFVKDGEGGVWIGTEAGLSHHSNGIFRNYTDMNGLANNVVTTINQDFEGNIWVGTYGGGVDMLPGEKFVHYTVQQGLLSNMITSFTQSDDESIWIGTYGGGISRLNNGNVTNYTVANGLIDNQVYTLYHTTNNDILIGTRNGISRYENGKMSSDPLTASLPDLKVRNFLETENGDLWIATYGGGIAQFRDNQLVKVWDTDTGLIDNIVMKMILRDDGSIWAATYGGISIIRSDGTVESITTAEGLIQNSVLSIFEDHDGHIWAGTFAGLSKINGDQIINYNTENGLHSNVIYFIGQDNYGRIWLGTNDGLIRFEHEIDNDIDDPNRIRDILKFKRYSLESGLTADEMNANAIFQDRSGDLWLGSVLGVNHFRWQLDQDLSVGPPVHIERIRLFDGYVEVDRAKIFKQNQNFIGFEYVGLSYSNPSEVVYEYRLSGIDKSWQRTKQRVVRYTTLPDGEFTFEVRARNADGFWSESVASISFTIQPPVWKRWWFILLLIIAIIVTGMFLYNYYKISRLVDLERIRIRIASDLHDDVGASLTEIALQADYIKATQRNSVLSESLQQIGDMSRKIVTTMDDIVWSIDARNDTFGDFHDRMQDYANNVLTPVDIEPIFHFSGFESDKVMPLEIRQNLYLIFKEAVNNAAKHSKATRIEIIFLRVDQGFELIIADNGMGMPEHIRSGGHGVKNMKLRAARIHAQIEIENKNGLKISITGKGI